MRYTDAILAVHFKCRGRGVGVGNCNMRILLIWGLRPGFDIAAIALGFLMALILALGIGTLNCFLVSMFPVWERFWAILNRPLFVISTLFFLFEIVPHPYDTLLWYNPLVHIVGQVRIGMYPTYAGGLCPQITYSRLGSSVSLSVYCC